MFNDALYMTAFSMLCTLANLRESHIKETILCHLTGFLPARYSLAEKVL